MTQQKWIRITHRDKIPLREGRAVKVGDREIAVFNLGDRFLAVDNRCPHQGGPLSDGIVSGSAVVCPLHAWKIDLESGAVLKPADTASCLHAYPTRVEEGVVSLNISDMEAGVECGTPGPSASQGLDIQESTS
jgi:nitrite reductase (NADH) small subunit